MQRIYSWRENTPVNLDPQIVGACLDDLGRRLGRPFEGLTPDDVVQAAADPSHPLHGYFQWDNEIAGPLHRRAQARVLINGIRFVDAGGGKNDPQIIRVSIVVNNERVYGLVSLAMESTETRRQVLSDALRGLRGWQKRYTELSDMPSVARIVEAIDDFEREIAETEPQPDPQRARRPGRPRKGAAVVAAD